MIVLRAAMTAATKRRFGGHARGARLASANSKSSAKIGSV